MKYILVLFLFLVSCTRTQAVFLPVIQQQQLSVKVIYVQPKGETFTELEKEQANAGIVKAFQFWDRHITIYPYTVVSTELLTTTINVYQEPLNVWYSALQLDNPILTIFVVDNSTSQLGFFSSHFGGYAQEFYNIIVVTNTPFPDPKAYEAALTHELGHVLYRVPDLYYGRCTLDIMCMPLPAYKADVIGCKTLQNIGKECYTVSIPLTVK